MSQSPKPRKTHSKETRSLCLPGTMTEGDIIIDKGENLPLIPSFHEFFLSAAPRGFEATSRTHKVQQRLYIQMADLWGTEKKATDLGLRS